MEYTVMDRPYQPLLFVLARCSRNQLIRQIEFLKAENEMLRKRIPLQKITLKPEERARLVQLGQAVGPAVRYLITIVRFACYRTWISKVQNKEPQKRMGRPRTPAAIRELVLRLARETGWGYTRILGELRKLGYQSISRQTVVNILKSEGLDPGPQRGPNSWDDMLKRHATTLWQCDFFSKRLATRRGIRQAMALVFINLATRRVWISPCTTNPTAAWVEQQSGDFIKATVDNGQQVTLITRDRADHYGPNFGRFFQERGIEVRKLAYRSPNLNAYVERFIQSIQKECLDYFLIFGEKHFDYLVKEYVEHYHTERPHQGLGNQVPSGEPPPISSNSGNDIRCRTRLGGLLNHYWRAAA